MAEAEAFAIGLMMGLTASPSADFYPANEQTRRMASAMISAMSPMKSWTEEPNAKVPADVPAKPESLRMLEVTSQGLQSITNLLNDEEWKWQGGKFFLGNLPPVEKLDFAKTMCSSLEKELGSVKEKLNSSVKTTAEELKVAEEKLAVLFLKIMELTKGLTEEELKIKFGLSSSSEQRSGNILPDAKQERDSFLWWHESDKKREIEEQKKEMERMWQSYWPRP
jgi:hypothetical protein